LVPCPTDPFDSQAQLSLKSRLLKIFQENEDEFLGSMRYGKKKNGPNLYLYELAEIRLKHWWQKDKCCYPACNPGKQGASRRAIPAGQVDEEGAESWRPSPPENTVP
jgi:hypothetical protein